MAVTLADRKAELGGNPSRPWRSFDSGSLLVTCAIYAAFATALAHAQTLAPTDLPGGVQPIYVVPGGPRTSTLYADGRQIDVETQTSWRFMCGSHTAGADREVLIQLAQQHADHSAGLRAPEENRQVEGGPINIVYNMSSGMVPEELKPAFSIAACWIESKFDDPISVVIDVEFIAGSSLPPGVLGAASSEWASTNWWPTGVQALVFDGVPDGDVADFWLPALSIPVRYDGLSGVVTYEDRAFWTRANFRATVGSISGRAGEMVFNRDMPWMPYPCPGYPDAFSLADVVVHETGHIMGFTSNAECIRENPGDPCEYVLGSEQDLTTLDLFRFQRTAGNPGTEDEFKSFPRLVDFNAPDTEPEDHISDIITSEFIMSDGDPWQASHFREQSPPIGVMDPALAIGEEHCPEFFTSADIAMFDVIGYDYPRAPEQFPGVREATATITFIEPMPTDLRPGQLADDDHIFLMLEQQGVQFNVDVDAKTWCKRYDQNSDLEEGHIGGDDGGWENVYLLHYDSIGLGSDFIWGTIRFSCPILGIIERNTRLHDTDLSGVNYAGQVGRGFELEGRDWFEIGCDRRTLTVGLANQGDVDELRIITAADCGCSCCPDVCPQALFDFVSVQCGSGGVTVDGSGSWNDDIIVWHVWMVCGLTTPGGWCNPWYITDYLSGPPGVFTFNTINFEPCRSYEIKLMVGSHRCPRPSWVGQEVTIPGAPPPPNMEGWWTGDRTTENFLEYLGHHGSWMGPGSGGSYTPGHVGWAFYMPGTDNFVEVPDDFYLNFSPAGSTTDFTIDAWIKPYGTGQFPIVDKLVALDDPDCGTLACSADCNGDGLRWRFSSSVNVSLA